MPVIEITEANLFVLSVSEPDDIPLTVRFAHRVAEEVGQNLYVAAFSVDGRALGSSVPEGSRKRSIVFLGRQDAIRVKRFDGGKEIVLWQPPDGAWLSQLIGSHWDYHEHMCWGLFVDRRDTAEVACDLQATWSQRHRFGDHSNLLESTVGPERKLAMLSYDSYSFFGKASPDCWDFVRSLLKEISGGSLDVYDLDADEGLQV